MPDIWQTMSAEETAVRLQVDTSRGLGADEARARLERVGLNTLEKGPDIALWQMFLNQFKDFMVLVLLAATAISGFLGEWSDAVTISIIVLLNAILGVVQEQRAERSMEALRELTSPEARVVRDGVEIKIPAAELVPGDIVLLEAGDRVPADIRLARTVDLEAVEAVLTGESNPVCKHTRPLEKQVGPADAGNMLYMGTVLTRGRGLGIVVATGMATEVGQIAGMIKEAEQEPTPLQRRLAQLGKGLVTFCLAVCAVVVIVGIQRGEPVYRMFLTGVSLAVAAIPEGLPAIVTVALAIGVQRMINRNSIIRRLPAVETLGCATFICSDKTGTLTQNEMTVRRVHLAGRELEVTGEGYDPKGKFKGDGLDTQGADFAKMMSIAALCNNATLVRNNIAVGGLFRKPGQKKDPAWTVSGDPTEGALLVMAAKAGFWRERLEKKMRRLAEIPFDSDRKRMTVIYKTAGGRTEAYIKGAPDVVLGLCTHFLRDGRPVPLDKRTRGSILAANSAMADGALRVLAVAYRELSPGMNAGEAAPEEIESNLVFVGLAGMIDPPRPAAIQAVHTCRRAGIRVAMITGDHRLTARAVAREMGIAGRGSRVLTGAELEEMSEEELARVAENVHVYARVSPRHKLRIVRALKRNGHVVAMTGDGVNDAPAVKEADIGIAMGVSGTDVTREASAMVLADDNFSSIVAAVEEGRGIYDNIRKFIRYLLSCNVGEVLVMFLAVLGGMPLPLLPIQILWMNLVTDGLPAMALGVDPIDRNIMRRPPRDPQESIFSHGLGWRILSSGTVIAVLTLAVFGLSYADGRNLDLARTMAFNTLVFLQLVYVFSCRSEHATIWELGWLSNPHLVGATLISAVLQISVNYIPFLQPVFHTVPLGVHHWLTILGVALLPTLAGTVLGGVGSRLRERVTYLRV
ncbi:calcium-translocating P-type ATPase, SERCA-type [Desulfoscipio geothermicus]|uniref:P-type Ca(2+) transporter n=1 Tax=Desulfoscipio geothermicus DSM 3669 TaxID=1121426 RepID=A0A1I6DJJ3_9FIRM|nr:calcium-translocating P-type ATPase, SERCA-type [Desulfoscipio geothermicus]SFR05599.1 Ca2+-transporting ATPase [Desulfoscipio geothermicus DSM 3669]